MRLTLLALLAITAFAVITAQDGNTEEKRNFYLEAYYNKFPIDQLKKLALAGETFVREKNNQTDLLGGLHDYIDSLSREEIAKIVANFVDENPELSDGQIESLAEINYHLNFLGLDAFLGSFKLDKLKRIAYGVEAYLRKVRNQEAMTGGLLNVIPYLNTKEEVISVILELAGKEKKLLNSSILEYLGQHEIASQIEFRDFLNDKDKKFLVTFAAACEKYERDSLGLTLFGGVADYAWSLNREELVNFILNKSLNFPLITGKGFILRLISENKLKVNPAFFLGINSYLNDLEEAELDFIYKAHTAQIDNLSISSSVEEFGSLSVEQKKKTIRDFLSRESDHKKVETASHIISGGLANYLAQKGEQILSDYCCAAETLYRDINKITLFGGINDSVKTLTKQQKIEFILENARDVPELFTNGRLKQVVKEKGGCWRKEKSSN